MIYVTVGSQLPFDRLINVIDFWAGENSDEELFAQIGRSKNPPKNFESIEFLTPSASDQYFKKAQLIISHVGMGSILTAIKYNKPMIVLPRKHELIEVRNNHQEATAKWVDQLPNIFVAWDEYSLLDLLNSNDKFNVNNDVYVNRQSPLIEYISDSISSS